MTTLTTRHLSEAVSVLDTLWEMRDLPTNRAEWTEFRLRALEAMINLKVHGLTQPVQVREA